jgi:alpha-tubulin suppressor-like RCC1 family protein
LFFVLKIFSKMSNQKVFGHNAKGQLGLGGGEERWKPVQNDCLKGCAENGGGILQLASGYSHTLCLNQDGHLFSFGSNSFGQCGTKVARKANPIPLEIQRKYFHNKRIVSIAVGPQFSAAVSQCGCVYTCMYNNKLLLSINLSIYLVC